MDAEQQPAQPEWEWQIRTLYMALEDFHAIHLKPWLDAGRDLPVLFGRRLAFKTNVRDAVECAEEATGREMRLSYMLEVTLRDDTAKNYVHQNCATWRGGVPGIDIACNIPMRHIQMWSIKETRSYP
jgi:hypothetical protein